MKKAISTSILYLLLSALLALAAAAYDFTPGSALTVYVDNVNGSDALDGLTAETPFATLTKAYKRLREADGGTLVISGSVTVPSSGFAPADAGGAVVWTSVADGVDYRASGASLKLYGNFAAGNDTYFDNINFDLYKSGVTLSGRHRNFGFGAGVVCTDKSGAENFRYPLLVGGWNYPQTLSEANSQNSYTLTVAGGTWLGLVGGNRRTSASHALGVLSGDICIFISGGSFTGGGGATVASAGSEYDTGRIYTEISGGDFACTYYMFRPLSALPTDSALDAQAERRAQAVTRITGGSFSGNFMTGAGDKLSATIPNRSNAAMIITGGSFAEATKFFNRGLLGSFVLRCSEAMKAEIKPRTERAIAFSCDLFPVTEPLSTVSVESKLASLADPYAVEKDGHYYFAYSAGTTINGETVSAIHIAESAEVLFSDMNYCSSVVFNASETDLAGAKKEYWAPELHYFSAEEVGAADAGWYIYFTADDGANANHRMHVLRADDPENPMGSFSMVGKLETDGDLWAIDGTVLKYDGKLYLIWSGTPVAGSRVQNLYIQPMKNPYTMEAAPCTLISTPERDWELLNGHINEGPQVLLLGDTINILYSANGSSTEYYRLGMLTLTGSDPMDAAAWTKSESALFESDPSVSMYGTGHSSYLQNHRDGTWWIYYHANAEWVEDDWSSGTSTWWAGRKTYIQPFTVAETEIGGKPYSVPVFGSPLGSTAPRPLTVASPDFCAGEHLFAAGTNTCRICSLTTGIGFSAVRVKGGLRIEPHFEDADNTCVFRVYRDGELVGSFTGGDSFTDAVPTGTYRYRIEVLREGKLLATSNETAVAVKEIGEVRFTDVNADGKIDLHDALLTLRKALSDEDGAQLADVLLILRHVGGSIDLFTF